jgi:hypothetical protein
VLVRPAREDNWVNGGTKVRVFEPLRLGISCVSSVKAENRGLTGSALLFRLFLEDAAGHDK